MMKNLRPTVLLAASLVVPLSGASAAVTPLEDGFTEESWERTGLSPCKGGASIRKLAGGDYVHIFTDPVFKNKDSTLVAPTTFVAPADHSVTLTYLLVGGGGGGGGCCGGGGGGAQVVEGSVTLNPGDVLTVEVGRGGFPLKNAGYSQYLFPNIYMVGQRLEYGTSAGSSSQGGTTRLILNGDTANPIASAIGGGGGAYHESKAPVIEGAGSGGNGASHTYAPGGGSMWASGGAPVAGDHAGHGADGCSTCIAGEIRYFGGGGGGGAGDHAQTTVGGTGGIGGGGNGTDWGHQFIGYPGEDGTGGGGGGGPNAGGYIDGGKGGDGIVIIRYPGAELTPVVNGCIDRTVEGDVAIGEYAAASGAGVQVKTASAQAQGGNEIRQLSTGEFVHKFTESGTFTAPANEDLAVDYLVIGGGGAGGGKYSSAGGGAGGVRYGRLMVPAGEAVTVTVGTGGVKGAGTGAKGGDSKLSLGADVITTAHGGGGGTGWDGGSFGVSGGSGGGAYAAPVDFGEGTSGGYREVSVRSTHGYGVGGGGAGRMGCQNVGAVGGAGGAGVKCAITGESLWYAGGGAGCVRTASANTAHGGLGGSGIGGNGAEGSNPATDPKPNTGSGGGGGGCTWTESGAGSGASSGADGVVILRYSTPAIYYEWEDFDGVVTLSMKAGAAPDTSTMKLFYSTAEADLADLESCPFIAGNLFSYDEDPECKFIRWNLSSAPHNCTCYFRALIVDGSGERISGVFPVAMPQYSGYAAGVGGERRLVLSDLSDKAPEAIHVFNEIGEGSFVAPLLPVQMRYLILGGGGSGGYGHGDNRCGGGGGGGGFYANTVETLVEIPGEATCRIVVGDGGKGGSGIGQDGESSLFELDGEFSYIALGGGGGGNGGNAGRPGGNGGGAGGANTNFGAGQQQNAQGQVVGFPGTTGRSGNRGGGAGGGAGATGKSAKNDGFAGYQGGDGAVSDITGESLYYGGGGGGGNANGQGAYNGGGKGGGGNGSLYNNVDGSTDGTNGLGGGGGGGGGGSTHRNGGNGGSGVVILRYELSPFDPDRPFGQFASVEFTADAQAVIVDNLILSGGDCETVFAYLNWWVEGAAETNVIVLSESLERGAHTYPGLVEVFPYGTNVSMYIAYSNANGYVSTTATKSLSVPPLTLFEPDFHAEAFADEELRTAAFTGQVSRVGFGETVVDLRYGPDKDNLLYVKRCLDFDYESVPGGFDTLAIPCAEKGAKMPTVFYRYELIERADGRVIQAWTNDVKLLKIYTPMGTIFGIR